MSEQEFFNTSEAIERGVIAKCSYCGQLIGIDNNGQLEAHYDFYPTRWCEGGGKDPKRRTT